MAGSLGGDAGGLEGMALFQAKQPLELWQDCKRCCRPMPQRTDNRLH
jgi:hypothetical protein